MPKPVSYAKRVALEKTPVVDGTQYRAEKVKRPDQHCMGCAGVAPGLTDNRLCLALPPCTKAKRLDGENVRYVDCGKAVR